MVLVKSYAFLVSRSLLDCSGPWRMVGQGRITRTISSRDHNPGLNETATRNPSNVTQE